MWDAFGEGLLIHIVDFILLNDAIFELALLTTFSFLYYIIYLYTLLILSQSVSRVNEIHVQHVLFYDLI